MTPEQQRIAIAEACGFTRIAHHPPNDPWGYLGKVFQPLPCYPHDLNACHEMENLLTTAQKRDAYSLELAKVCKALVSYDGNRMNVEGWWLIHATAAQRCEAFLKATGKWRDK